jgi:hypothetical protein
LYAVATITFKECIMDKIIVYVDDAAHALAQINPMKASAPSAGMAGPATQWILVACPPRMTKHISRWLSNSARENWRRKWSDNLFAQIAPALQSRGDVVLPLVAKGVLTTLTAQLVAQHPGARVLDARRIVVGRDLLPIAPDQPMRSDSRWSVPGAVAGMGAVLILAAD